MNVAIIQARLGSTRLPGKVLKNILKKPMLWHIVNRLKESKSIDSIIIATSANIENDAIREFCQQYEIDCFSGSEENVLERFYLAAKSAKAKTLFRITGDCPLIDPYLIDKLYSTFVTENYDHIGIATGAGAINEKNRYPDGLDAECFSFKALEQAYNEAIKQTDLEHVTPYIWRNKTLFKVGSMNAEKDYSSMRWTVDNMEDFNLVEKIYNGLYKENEIFALNDILNFFENNKELFENNKHFIGEEGYEELWNN